MIVAATGLFQAVSSESHPVDVEIYDNVTEDEQPSDDNSEAGGTGRIGAGCVAAGSDCRRPECRGS